MLLKPYDPNRLLEVVDRAVTQALARRRVAVSLSDARRSTGMRPAAAAPAGVGIRPDAATALKRRT